MTNAKHTPGPWTSRATGFYQNPFKVLAPRRAGAVANIPHSAIARDGEQEANARLISAAPDMLAALEASPMLECHHDYNNSACWPCMARAAIAKAKGEQAQ